MDILVEMIPISRISVLNPRARNKRQHRDIVNNIEAIGLKRPITVSRHNGPGGPRYDLVCGEGRLEAFQMLGQSEIPAVVIEASEDNCLVMSLVENIARRTPRPIDLMREIGALRARGYTDAAIAKRIGVGAQWVYMIAALLEKGEDRLVVHGLGNKPEALAEREHLVVGEYVPDDCTGDDDHTTHCRDTLLVHVSLDLGLDELADVPTAQEPDRQRGHEDDEHERDGAGEEEGDHAVASSMRSMASRSSPAERDAFTNTTSPGSKMACRVSAASCKSMALRTRSGAPMA